MSTSVSSLDSHLSPAKRTGGWPLTREFRSVLEAGEYLAALQDGSPFEYVFMERRTIAISDWEIMAETSLPSDLIDAPDGRPTNGAWRKL